MKENKKNIVKSVLSIALSAALSMSIACAAFAAADPVENAAITNATDKNEWDNSIGKANAVAYIKEADFSSIDEHDSIHGGVVHIGHRPDATMSSTVTFKHEFAGEYAANVNKMLSFDFYIQNNTIPFEFKLVNFADANETAVTETIGEVQVNFSTRTTDTPMETINTEAAVKVTEDDGKKILGTVNLDNSKWHRMDVMFSAGTLKYYIDGTLVGSGAGSEKPFNGLHIVVRKGNWASTVADTDGIYLDNLRTVAYDDKTAFYGQATAKDGAIAVKLSESASALSDLSGIKVISAATGEEVEAGTAEWFGYSEINVPLTGTLRDGAEYVVQMPGTITGISGKKLYSDIYFSIPAASSSEEFVNTDISEYTDLSTNHANIYSPDASWFTNQLIGVKALEDDDHGTVLFTADSSSYKKIYRYGIACGMDAGNNPRTVDLTKGSTEIEFDLKIVGSGRYAQFYIQPYSTKSNAETIADADLANGSAANTNFLCNVSFSRTAAAIGLDTTAATTEVGNTNTGGIRVQNNFAEWRKIKIALDNSDTANKKVELYVDGKKVAEAANVGGALSTNLLRGVRFRIEGKSTESGIKDIFYVDNVKISQNIPAKGISKIRIYNPDGEEFGGMATAVKPSAQKAEIYFDGDMNVEDAYVTVTDGTDTITTTKAAYDADVKKLTVTLDTPLKKATEYTLSVSGIQGVTVNTAMKFTTSDDGEYLIENLRVVDAAGNEVTEAPAAGTKLYVAADITNTTNEQQKVMLIGASYNNMAMESMKSMEFTVNGGERKSVTVSDGIEFEVKSEESLEIMAFAWENFETNRPLVDNRAYSFDQ